MNTYCTFAACRNDKEVSRKLRNVEKHMHPHMTFLVKSYIVTVGVRNNIYVSVEQSRIKVCEELIHITIAKSLQSLVKIFPQSLPRKATCIY